MIIDQLFTQPIFEAADPNKLIVSVTILPMSAEDDAEVKDFDLTGRFQGDARSQINQATAYLTKFFEARGINFTNFQATYQGQIITQQNVGSMEPQNDAERELQTMANQMRNKHPAVKENASDPITQFASNAHEEWRRNFDPTGTKPRIKKNSDGTEGDINVPFEKLHPDWKKENLAAGHAAHHAVKHFGRDMEKAAEHVHNEWMKRNPKADYNAAQHVPYDDLSDDEKEKDRVHVRTMMRLMGHQLNEFAPSDDGEGPDQEEILRRLAAHWWNGNEHQMARAEHTLAAMGWEIGEDEGYDDGGVFVVRPGDEHGRSYLSWPHEELDMNEVAPPGAKAERMVKHIKQGYAKDGKLTPKEKGIAFATAWKAHNAGRVEEGEITKNATGLKHRATDKYGAGDDEPHHYTGGRSGFSEPGKYARDLEHVNKQLVKDLDASMGISWKNRGPKGIEVDEQGVTEAAQGHTIEAHGVRGMDRHTWHKTFRNTDQMIAWAEKHDAEIIGTRDLEQARHHNLSPAMAKGVAEGLDKQALQKELIIINKLIKVMKNSWQQQHLLQKKQELLKQLKQGVAEGKHFKTAYGWAGGSKPGGGTYKHPDQIKADREAKKKAKEQEQQKNKQPDVGVAKGPQIDEMFADQGSGSTDRDNADYMKRRNAAKKAGYTGRETKAGTWRVFKDGNAVAAAGPFKSADEAAAWIKKHKQGITEMDKSEPSAGRDTGPRPGPDREAKPITAKKATKDAGRMLNRAFQDSRKKKDVKEGLLGSDPNRGQKVPDWAKGGIIGKIGRKLDPAWSDRQMTVPQHLLSKQSSVPATNSPATKDMPKDTSITPTRAIPQRAATAVPPTFPANTNARGGGGAANLPDRLPGEHDTQLPYRRGMDTKPQIRQIVPSMVKESDPLMLKLKRALIKEGRVKELADDLKTMSDADFMKKYGKAKAAIRKDMKRVDEAAQTNYTPQEMADILSGKKTQQQVDAERAKKIDDQTDDLVMRVDKQGRRVDKNGKLLPPPKTWTNPPINPPPGKMQQYEGLDEQDAAGQQFVGTGTSSNWQMSVDIAAMNAKRKAAQSIAGTNSFQGVQLPPGTKYGPQDTKSDGTGKYVSTYTITLPAPSQSAEPAPAAPANNYLDSSPATSGATGSMSTGAPAAVGPATGNYMKVNELSTNKLSQYKTAAAKDAKKADQAGDFKRGDKRLGGMVQATKKQFDNDAKKVDESRAARRALMARIVNAR